MKTLGWEAVPMMRSYVVEDFFEDQDESFYTKGIQALQYREKKCVDRRRREGYVEK